MRSILLKGMDNSYKSNIFLLKSTIEKINTNRNIINKNPTKSKLILKIRKLIFMIYISLQQYILIKEMIIL